MTHYEILIRHLTRHNATILLKTPRLVMWEYNNTITVDEFNADGSAIGRSFHKA
jgi:hypothetical protein